MINIFFIHKNITEKDYFLSFFEELDQKIINLEFHQEDQLNSVDNLAIIIIKNLEDLDKVHSLIPRRLYFGVSFKNFSEESKSEFYKKSAEFKYLKGVFDLDKEYEFNLPLLHSAYQGELENFVTSTDFSKEVESILTQSLADLQRLKKIHERIVPIRQETIKGLTLTSKFGAGESAGGEFLDIVKGDKECLILLSSSSSYVVSSIVLTHFDYFRDKKNFPMFEIEKFLKELSEDIHDRNFETDEKRILDTFIARIDLSSLVVEGIYFGNFEVYRTKNDNLHGNDLPFDSMFFEKGYFSSRLERSEKLMIISPGLKRNLNESYPGTTTKSLLSGFEDQKPRQIINELFFQLKKDVSRDFLAHDATAIHIEVDQNVIVQI